MVGARSGKDPKLGHVETCGPPDTREQGVSPFAERLARAKRSSGRWPHEISVHSLSVEA